MMGLVYVLSTTPFSGQNAQCKLLESAYGVQHVSVEDLLREVLQTGGELSEQVKACMDEGKPVPAAVAVDVLRPAIEQRKGAGLVLLEGFPQSLEQLEAFEQQVLTADGAIVYEVAGGGAAEVASSAVVEALKARGRAALVPADASADAAALLESSKPLLEPLLQRAAAGAPAPAATAPAPPAEEPAPAPAPEAAPAEAAAEAAAAPKLSVEVPPPAAALAAAAAPAAVPRSESSSTIGTADSGEPPEQPPPQTPTGGMLRGRSVLDMSTLLKPVVICGPSGVGKGTIIEAIMKGNPAKFSFCVSHTTRDPRPGEVNGQHYHFVSMDVMKASVEKGAFLEHAHVHGNMYGTSIESVAAVSSQGKVAILDIDVQGAEQVRASCLGRHCLFIFIAPPSHEELERRLRGRGTETEEKVLKRLAGAAAEIEKSKAPGLFDRVVVNDDLEGAVLQVGAAINEQVPGAVPGAAEALVEHIKARAASEAAAASAAAAAAAVTAAAAAAAASATLAPAPAPVAPEKQQPAPAATAPVAAAAAAPAAPAVAGGTAALLDFGFGAAAGSGLAAKGMPVRAYMDATVVPVLREGLRALNVARPDDPLQFLGEFILAQRRQTGGRGDAGMVAAAPQARVA